MKQESLFAEDNKRNSPLASRVRPKTLDEFSGQQHLLAHGKVLREIIENDQVTSIIFGESPGSGKQHWLKLLPIRQNQNLLTCLL